MVGGSTKIPKIQQLLANFFVGKEITFATKEKVSLGAAEHAATLSGEADTKTVLLTEVNGLSLGVATEGIDKTDLDMSIIIPRNTTIPTKRSQEYTTAVDNQIAIKLTVYEGEHNKVKCNHFLDEFRLSGITLAPCGVPKIRVTMEINIDGILNVTATDIGNESQNEIAINYNKKRFGKEDIDRMIKENEELLEYKGEEN